VKIIERKLLLRTGKFDLFICRKCRKEEAMKKTGFILLMIAIVLVVTGIPSYAEEINACKDIKKGDIRIVDDPIECDLEKEEAIIWSQTGPAGATGDTGPAGATGDTGPQGPAGADGLNCWDLNSDGVCDATEDTDDDGFCTAADCQGQTGSVDADTLNSLIYAICANAEVTAASLPFGFCHKTVFISSELYTGDLGGLAGADAKCQTLAEAAGLLGHYKAWLSTTTVAAGDRLTHSNFPYKNVDNETIADDWTDLIDGALSYPIIKDEYGTPMVSMTGAWTNTSANGTSTSTWTWGAHTCNEWQDDDDAYCQAYCCYLGICVETDCCCSDACCADWATWSQDCEPMNGYGGSPFETDAQWTAGNTLSCTASNHLYCIQQ
jgi:hypothetical protein